MGIADKYDRVMKAEKHKLSRNASFSKKVQKIDELRSSGFLKKKIYRFPMRDTLGTNINSPQKHRSDTGAEQKKSGPDEPLISSNQQHRILSCNSSI